MKNTSEILKTIKRTTIPVNDENLENDDRTTTIDEI